MVTSRLSELAKMLMWPTLEYMAGRGDAVFREEVVTLQVREEMTLGSTVGIAPFCSIPTSKSSCAGSQNEVFVEKEHGWEHRIIREEYVEVP